MIFPVLRGETPSAGKLEILFSLEKVSFKPSSQKRDKACPEEREKAREEIKENNNQKKKAQKQVFNNRFA